MYVKHVDLIPAKPYDLVLALAAEGDEGEHPFFQTFSFIVPDSASWGVLPRGAGSRYFMRAHRDPERHGPILAGLVFEGKWECSLYTIRDPTDERFMPVQGMVTRIVDAVNRAALDLWRLPTYASPATPRRATH